MPALELPHLQSALIVYQSVVEEMAKVADLIAFNDKLTPALYIFGIFAIVFETLHMKWRGRDRDVRSRRLGVKCGVLAFGFVGLFQVAIMFTVHSWLFSYRLFDLGLGWTSFAVCFIANDLMFYVSHRHQHEVRVLWAAHVVHHSPRHYDLTTGVRGSVFGALVTFPYYFWIPLLGVHPVVFVIVDTAFKFYGLAYHTEAVGKLGFLERFLITPANHRVHHATNVQYLDRNYGGFFVLFDRLFGSYEPEVQKPIYGITKDWHGYDLVDCQVHEIRDLWRDVRAAPTLMDSVRYLLKPPGWRHDASGATAAQLRATSAVIGQREDMPG